MRLQLIPVLVASLMMIPVAANAQGFLNWAANQAGQIQQDMGTGLINPNQAAGLQNREAQIQAQEQNDLARNGGYLSPLQQRQISSELKGVNRALGRDVSRNNPNGVLPTGYVSPMV